MAAYLVEMRHPNNAVWMTLSGAKTQKEGEGAAGKWERKGWLARVTRKAPEPTVDYKTGLLRERGADKVVYVTAA